MTRKSIRVCSYVVFPLTCGLAAVSENFILVLLTDKWLQCVPFLKLACINYALMTIGTANLQAIKGIGRSDIYLKLEIIKKIIGILLLLVSMNFGVIAIAISAVFVTVLCEIVNIYPNAKCISYGYKEQALDLIPATISTMLMWIVVWEIGKFIPIPIVALLVQILVGGLFYIIISYFINRDSQEYTLAMIKKLLHHKK